MPICTLVSGVRSSCEAAAMNSDFRRLTSLRCVTSSSNVTAPTRRPSASFIGVDRMRNARRAPSTAHGSTAAALSDATAACDSRTSVTACPMRGSRATTSIDLPTVSARAPKRRSAAGLIRVTSPSLSVTMTGS